MRLVEFKKEQKHYWHGSNIDNLEELTPTKSKLFDYKEVVFSAIYSEVAVAMSNHWTDNDFLFGREISDEDDPTKVPYIMKELYKGAFSLFFNEEIFLYKVPAFYFISSNKLQDFEKVSFIEVPIIKEYIIKDPLSFLSKSKMVKLEYF